MDLIERLRREADISARPGQMDRLNALADEFAAALAQDHASQPAAPSGAVNVVGMPEFDGLLDHIYEHGTTAEGVIERANAFARAVLAQYAPQQPASQPAAPAPCAFRALLAEARQKYQDSDAAGDVLAWLDERVLDVDHAASVAVPDEAIRQALVTHVPRVTDKKVETIIRYIRKLAAAPVAPEREVGRG